MSKRAAPPLPLRLKPLDFPVLALALALTLGTALAVYSGAESGARVVIQGSGRTWTFPLDAEERIAVPGPLGETVVEISGRRAFVRASPCANQTCVAAGHIGRPGNWTACLPNKVLVAIEGRDDEDEEDGKKIDAGAW
jgi:hypothetical protein